jgi:hypothetical protein
VYWETVVKKLILGVVEISYGPPFSSIKIFLAGIPTYILLNATDLDPPGRMTKLELLNLYGESLVEVPLVLNTDHPTLYNVSGFVPPDNKFFYVKVG